MQILYYYIEILKFLVYILTVSSNSHHWSMHAFLVLTIVDETWELLHNHPLKWHGDVILPLRQGNHRQLDFLVRVEALLWLSISLLAACVATSQLLRLFLLLSTANAKTPHWRVLPKYCAWGDSWLWTWSRLQLWQGILYLFIPDNRACWPIYRRLFSGFRGQDPRGISPECEVHLTLPRWDLSGQPHPLHQHQSLRDGSAASP